MQRWQLHIFLTIVYSVLLLASAGISTCILVVRAAIKRPMCSHVARFPNLSDFLTTQISINEIIHSGSYCKHLLFCWKHTTAQVRFSHPLFYNPLPSLVMNQLPDTLLIHSRKWFHFLSYNFMSSSWFHSMKLWHQALVCDLSV